LTRTEAWFTQRLGEAERTAIALHDDGFAIWKVTQDWDGGHPAHRLFVEDFCAATPAAHVALWHTILSVDLVGPIEAYCIVAPDDPLPYLLTDQRALRTTDLNDFLWIKVIDIPAAFSARAYRTDDRIVIATPQGAFAVTAESCRATTDEPDLVCSAGALGPLLLGGVSAGELARGRRLSASADLLSRADAFFGSDPLPHCRTPF
jgi:predicted acetyltransferase